MPARQITQIKGEIQRIKAAEAAQQRQLAAAAQARIADQSTPTVSGVGVGASTPEGSTVAPPTVHGGVVGCAVLNCLTQQGVLEVVIIESAEQKNG